MERKDIADKVLEIIAEQAGTEHSKLTEDINIRLDGPNTLGLDSLDVAEYLMKLDDLYNVKVVDEDLPNITTLRDLIEYIAVRKIEGYTREQ